MARTAELQVWEPRSHSMPTFYIDVRDAGGMVRDEEGAQFPHVEDALEEAKASARDLVRQYMEDRIPLNAACVEVRDRDGRTVAALTVAELLKHPTHPHFKEDCAKTAQPGHR